MSTPPAPDAAPAAITNSEDDYYPLPSYASPHVNPGASSELNVLVCDESAISRLLWRMLQFAGLSAREAAFRLGLSPNAVQQYLSNRRCRPSLLWFLRLANLCGARVVIQFNKVK